jgi:hypothetical protein
MTASMGRSYGIGRRPLIAADSDDVGRTPTPARPHQE